MTPEEAQILRERVAVLESMLFKIMKSDRLILEMELELANGRNIIVGKGTGTKIATETTQKLGFYGATPVTRPARPTDAASIITTGTSLGIWA